jgi:hypothetical protein
MASARLGAASGWLVVGGLRRAVSAANGLGFEAAWRAALAGVAPDRRQRRRVHTLYLSL